MKSIATRNRAAAVTATIVATLLAPRPPRAAECTAASGRSARRRPRALYVGRLRQLPAGGQMGERTAGAENSGSDRVIPLAFHVDYWNQLGWIRSVFAGGVQRAPTPAQQPARREFRGDAATAAQRPGLSPRRGFDDFEASSRRSTSPGRRPISGSSSAAAVLR